MGSVKLRQFKLRIKKKTKILICTVCKELKVYDKIEGKEKEGSKNEIKHIYSSARSNKNSKSNNNYITTSTK